MNSIVKSCVSAPRLDGVTADELSAVSGGHNYMLSDGKGTGVVFTHDGLHAIRNGVVIIIIKNGTATVPPA